MEIARGELVMAKIGGPLTSAIILKTTYGEISLPCGSAENAKMLAKSLGRGFVVSIKEGDAEQEKT